MVGAETCSRYLKLDKGSFKGGPGAVAAMYQAVDKWLHGTLRDKGYVDARGGDVQRSAKISGFFKELFNDPKYRWLNPGAAGGSGPGTGSGDDETGSDKAARQRETVKTTENKKTYG